LGSSYLTRVYSLPTKPKVLAPGRTGTTQRKKMNMKNKSNIAKVALTVSLLVGGGVAATGMANAATNANKTKAAKIIKKKAAKKTSASAQAVTSTTVPSVPGSAGAADSHMGRRGGPVNLDNVAKVLGITTAELQTEL